MASNVHDATSEVIAYKEDKQPVQLVFDTWTPRPHFIVVQCKPTQDATPSELQATYAIIGRFLRENPQFDQDAILSFHRGTWYQKGTTQWHAHLCVPKQPYLNQAEIQITKIPSNKQWKNAPNVEEGMEVWLTEKVQEYAKYKEACIRKGISNQTLVENVHLSMFDSNSNEFQLVWMSPAPRIGIVARSSTTSTLTSLYTFMSKVRSDLEQELSRSDRSFSNFGCHLCLYVRGQSDTSVTERPGTVLTQDGRVNENSNIVGYIQMDESQYVQFLPRNLRQIWLAAFSRAEHFVST